MLTTVAIGHNISRPQCTVRPLQSTATHASLQSKHAMQCITHAEYIMYTNVMYFSVYSAATVDECYYIIHEQTTYIVCTVPYNIAT